MWLGLGRRSEFLGYEGHGFGTRGDDALQLRVFHGTEHGLERCAGLVSGGDEFAAGDERLGADGFLGRGLPALADVLPVVKIAAAGEAIHTMQGEVLLKA